MECIRWCCLGLGLWGNPQLYNIPELAESNISWGWKNNPIKWLRVSLPPSSLWQDFGIDVRHQNYEIWEFLGCESLDWLFLHDLLCHVNNEKCSTLPQGWAQVTCVLLTAGSLELLSTQLRVCCSCHFG